MSEEIQALIENERVKHVLYRAMELERDYKCIKRVFRSGGFKVLHDGSAYQLLDRTDGGRVSRLSQFKEKSRGYNRSIHVFGPFTISQTDGGFWSLYVELKGFDYKKAYSWITTNKQDYC